MKSRNLESCIPWLKLSVAVWSSGRVKFFQEASKQWHNWESKLGGSDGKLCVMFLLFFLEIFLMEGREEKDGIEGWNGLKPTGPFFSLRRKPRHWESDFPSISLWEFEVLTSETGVSDSSSPFGAFLLVISSPFVSSIVKPSNSKVWRWMSVILKQKHNCRSY